MKPPGDIAAVPEARSRFIAVLLTVFVSACIAFGQLAPYARGTGLGVVADRGLARSDFAAFYCAALAARTGHDPYETVSLQVCQSAAYRAGGLTFAENGVNPAPLPGYDFALFAPLTLLPYRVAGLLWIVILIACNVAASMLFAQMLGKPLWLILALFAITNGYICYQYGQTQPLVTLALVAAARWLQIGRPRLAAGAASFALIEPHVGIPVLLALFIWTRTRVVVAIACAAFAAVSLAAIGAAANVEYFARVLPAHAFAEVVAWFQYSLTSLLATLGVPAALALRIGSLQYAAMVLLGVVLAGPIARRIGPPAIVLFPAACAVLGGPFIHIMQITSALPFAVYAATRAPNLRAWAWLGAVLIATQWPLSDVANVPLAAVLIIGAAYEAFVAQTPRTRALVGVVGFALYLGANVALLLQPAVRLQPVATTAQIARAIAPYDPALASTQWAAVIRRSPDLSEVSPRRIAKRLPAWFALIAIMFVGLVIARRRPTAAATTASPEAVGAPRREWGTALRY